MRTHSRLRRAFTGAPQRFRQSFIAATTAEFALLAAAAAFVGGCAGGSGIASMFGTPFPYNTNVPTPTPTAGGSGTGSPTSGSGADRGENELDPCTLKDADKFIRISMRNLAPNDYIHYFLVMIAFVDGEPTSGAACKDDVDLYKSFGYQQLTANQEFGGFCLPAGALVYFHDAGRFRTGGGKLGAAIAPAQGTAPTYDEFFTASGALVPIPDIIAFHNPGTGDGAKLQVSRNPGHPCDSGFLDAETICSQDAFYYVDARDTLSGSTSLGQGSGRRTASEIQGTFCECTGFADPFQSLAAGGPRECHEFTRGGRIEYAFIRNDSQPTFPQLLWRVSDRSGALVHDFDSRSGVK